MSVQLIARVPVTVGIVWAILTALVPLAMGYYAPYAVRAGIRCVRTAVPFRLDPPFPADMCQGLADLYRLTYPGLMVDSMFRSLALLVGAAALALVSDATFMNDEHVMRVIERIIAPIGRRVDESKPYEDARLPDGSRVSLAAIAFTAQLTATRMRDVLDSDFITAANAKGLRTSWILGVHVMPHVRPVLLEALGSGLRVSVASLPIIEFLFNWRGIGQLALEAVGVHDAATVIFSAVVLTALFTTLSAIADLSRPRAIYEGA